MPDNRDAYVPGISSTLLLELPDELAPGFSLRWQEPFGLPRRTRRRVDPAIIQSEIPPDGKITAPRVNHHL